MHTREPLHRQPRGGEPARIGDAAFDRGGGRGRDAGEVRARTGALATDEVAVARRDAPLSRGDHLIVDPRHIEHPDRATQSQLQ